MIMLKDSVIEEILKFLDQCEGILLIQSVPPISLSLSLSTSSAYGRNVLSVVEQPLEQNPIPVGQNTVTYEARLLKSMFMKLWE